MARTKNPAHGLNAVHLRSDTIL